MTDTTVGIKVVADTSDVTAELGKIDTAAAKTARELSKVGQADGLSKVGDSAGAAAAKTESGTRALIGSIQRTTMAMEAGGRTTAKYYELLGQQRGLDGSTLAPYLAQLRAVETAQAKSNAALGGAAPAFDKVGLSAKQTAAALRGVPAQFTDIFTSLQGGQAPLTVFLQQGGQLKDMFGGAGNAARAMGGYIVGLINPFTLAAAAAVGLAVAYNQGANEAQAYTRALVLTGNAAGTTADQLGDMASNISDAVGTQGAAAEALAAMAGTGRVAAANLQYFSEVAVRTQSALGISAADMAKDFAELGKSPLTASERLTEKYRYLTAAVYEQIKAAQEQGRVEDAASIAQNAYAGAIEDRASKVKANLGTLETAWENIKLGAKKAWDAMLDVGREDTLSVKLARVRAQIEKANKPFDPAVGGNAEARAQLQANLQLEASLQRQIKGEAEKAAAKAASIKMDEAMQAWSREGEKFLSKEVLLQREVTKARNEGAAAGKSQEEIEKRIVLIREKYRNKGADKSNADALRKESALMAELAGLTSSFAGDWNALSAAYAKGKINLDQLTEAQAKLLAKQPAMKDAADMAAANEKSRAKFREDYARATEMMMGSMQKSISVAQDEADKNEELARTYGMTRTEIERVELARLEEQLAQRSSLGLTLDEIDTLNRLIEAKRRSVTAMSSVDAQTSSKAATDQIVSDYKRMSESIESSLTDALMRGFESGKSFGRNLMDTLKNMFKTLILQPTIKGILAPVSGAISSAFMPGAAQAATGGVSSGGGSAIGSAVGMAGSLFGAGGLAGSMAAGAGWLTGATTLGGSLAAAGSLAATGTLGGIASSIGMVAGALGPIGLALAAAVMIWKKLDTSGTYHTGGASSATSAGASTIRAESLGMAETRTTSATNALTASLASGMVKILDSTAQAFGKTAGYEAATAFADDTSKDGAWGALVIKKMGETVLDWNNGRASGSWAPKEFGDGEAGQKEYLAALSTSVRTALDSIGLPSWAQTMLDGVGEGASIEQMGQVVDSINATQRALSTMGASLTGFADLSDAAVSALMKASGGIESLAAGAGSFFNNFYSESERAAASTKAVAEALAAVGLQMPTTNAGYRSLVEQQMALGESGAPAVAALLKMNEAFAQAYPLIESNTDALEKQKAAQAAAADLQIQIMQLSGDAAGALRVERERELASMDASLRPLQERIYALQDEASAIDQIKSAAAGLISGADVAYSVLQRVVQTEKSAAEKAHAAFMKGQQERIDSATAEMNKRRALSDAIASTLGQMKMPGTEQADRASAQAQVAAALAIARAGGPLPPSDSLKDALSVLSRDSSSMFATMQDYQRDFYKTQSDLSALGSLSDAALSVDEKMLKSLEDQKEARQAAYDSEIARLDGILEYGQQQLDVLKGLDTTGLTIVQSLEAFKGAILAAQGNGYASSGAAINDAYKTSLGRAPDAAGSQFWQDKIASGTPVSSVVDAIRGSQEAQVQALYKQLLGRGADAGGLDFFLKSGASNEAIRAALMSSEEYKNRLPGFAVGTNSVPYDMTAMIHKDERIIPAADNRELMARLRNPSENSAAVVAELRTLRAENAAMSKRLDDALYSIAKYASEIADYHNKADAIGTPPVRNDEVPA